MATIEHLSASATGAAAATLLARDGAVVIDELVAPSVMDAVRAELAPYLDATPYGPDEFSVKRTRRTGGLVARSVVRAEFNRDQANAWGSQPMRLALGRWRRQRGTLAPAATATRAQAPSASRCQRRGLSRIGSDHPRTLLRSESPSSTAHPSGPERGAGKAKCTPDKLVGPGCHRWAGARMNSTTRAAHSTSLRGCCHHSKHHSPPRAGTPLYAVDVWFSSRMLSI